MAPPVQPPAGPSPRAPASPAAAPSTTATPVSGSITRADIVTLGRTGDPWAFVPLAIHALTIATDDHEVRFLLAAAYAKLGLRTAATETLDHLAAAFGTAAQSHPALAQLAQVLAQLPDDRVPLTTRLRTLERNLDALASRPVAPLDLRYHLGDWSARAAAMQCFSARGGNILFRDANRRWLRFADDATSVREQAPPPSTLSVEPVLFDGICPPWLFAHVASISPRRRDGQESRLTVVEPDLLALLDGLSLADLQSLLAEPRVHIYAGVDALDRFQQWLADHSEFHLGRTCFAGLSTRNATQSPAKAAAAPDAAAVLLAAREQQDDSFARVMQRGRDIYAPRDRAWWAQRYAQAATGGPPLRVLIPTSRFTTFVQHSSQDLAEALRAAGCEVRVLIEPDDALRFSALAFWNIYVDWQPDLVIAINYTRNLLPGGVPESVPFITWIQDQAGHLYSKDVGAALGEFDFVVGYLTPALFKLFDYPRRHTWYYPVLANESKFHNGPVSELEKSRFACDIGYVSHNSQTPEQLASDLAIQSPGPAQVATSAALIEFVQRMRLIVNSGLGLWYRYQMGLIAQDVVKKHITPAADEQAIARFLATYACPLTERILRHQMLDWAAELCVERGWRLKLYGRGWKQHPTLAQFACGELEHGSDLRAAYQCAKAHLHAGLGFHQHQRLAECALSGGLTLTRFKREDIDVMLLWWAMGLEAANASCMVQPAPRWSDDAGAWCVSEPAKPVSILDRLHNDLGFEIPERTKIIPEAIVYPSPAEPWPYTMGTPVPLSGAWLAGDPRDCGFWDRETFREVATRVVTQSAFRSGLAAWQRECARDSFTIESMATRLPGWLCAELTGRAR